MQPESSRIWNTHEPGGGLAMRERQVCAPTRARILAVEAFARVGRAEALRDDVDDLDQRERSSQIRQRPLTSLR